MKPKRLMIIFFSTIMLTATPRVMSHFNGYADALQQKAETEWLNFLLGFATPSEIDKGVATPKSTQPPAICTGATSEDIEPPVIKSRSRAKATHRAVVTKNHSYEYMIATLLSNITDDERDAAPDESQIDRKARERGTRPPSLRQATNAFDKDGRVKAEYLWSLTQSTLRGKNKAKRVLMREVAALSAVKTQPLPTVPVSFEKDVVHPEEPGPDTAEQDMNNTNSSSDDSMH